MQTYSFKNGSLLINGRAITDWAEGNDSIQARRLNDSSTHMMGPDGKMARAVSGDLSGEFVFKIKQTSADAGYLYSLVNADQVGRITNIATVVFRDSRRKDLAVGALGYIVKPADMVRGKDINVQEWRIVVENLMITQPDTKNDLLGKLGDSIGL